jgi:hypothetical protein
MTRAEIQAAIDTVRSSFSYDNPDRWTAAYDSLQPVRAQLRDASTVYAWIPLSALGVFFVALAAGFLGWLLGSGFSSDPSWLYAAPLLAFGVLLPSAQWLSDFLAKRREPLLELRDEIENACRPFDSVSPNAFVDPDDDP